MTPEQIKGLAATTHARLNGRPAPEKKDGGGAKAKKAAKK